MSLLAASEKGIQPKNSLKYAGGLKLGLSGFGLGLMGVEIGLNWVWLALYRVCIGFVLGSAGEGCVFVTLR